MSQLLASLVDGLLLGFVYGMAAMGLSLIWGVMRVINLGHGAIMALGMFGTYFLFTALGLNPYLAILIVAVMGLVFGFLVYGVAVHRVINAPYLSSLLATFAVNMMIIGVGTAVFTTSPRNINYSLGSLQVGPITLLGSRVASALATVLATAVLYLFLYRTLPGKAIRAVANNRSASELMGIPSAQVLALSFGIGTMLAAVAGGLISTFFPFTILSGDSYQPRSFVICVLGGMGNPLGALLGGLILGTMEGLIPVFMPVSWVPVLEFALFILILLIRPSGLFGAR
jgi:branched-subunit amino acid ABC-type transport system permease component